jgi:hypothetical protein
VSGPLDLSLVEAGEYELVCHSWDELVAMVPVFDREGRRSGEQPQYRRHVKGDLVTLNVEEARRLVRAGAVLSPEEAELARLRRAEREAALRVLAAGDGEEQR